MNNDTVKSKKLELQNYIEELESSLLKLKQQLDRLEQEEQHTAINNLEGYLLTVDHKYENFKNFCSIIPNEWRSLFGGNDKKTTSPRGK
ncbi:MAG: hypothetical protein KUG80_05025 [Gammaproteobacteria bacterium]|nr:hypothetical protein [Gammaproteobacteria bacterium]